MKRIPLACQLYSVRKSLARDFEGTMREVAAAGYEGVEFYGSLSRWSPEQISAICAETGLKVIGWHSGIDDFSPENIKNTIAHHKAIGNKTMVIPGLPAEMTASAAAWHRTAERFNEIVKILREEGMYTGYHNHYIEFALIDGEMPWDIIASETDKDFILQIDNGNAMHGKADPMVYLRKYPGRARTFHFKPYSYTKGYDVTPGVDDDVPWQETAGELFKQNATEWVIAEYETEALYNDIEGVKICAKNLGKFLER